MLEIKIDLIWPNVSEKSSSLYPPLGLGYIAAVLERNEYKPNVIDLTFQEEKKKLGFKSDIYGLSCTTVLSRNALSLAKEIKEKNPTSTIVFGGPHPTLLPNEIILNPWVDAVCIGEGEYAFTEIVQHIENGESLSDIKGIAYKEQGKPVFTEQRRPIENLDELPFPSQYLFPVEKYFEANGIRDLSIHTSRGCPGNCTYCQPTLRTIFGPKLRYRSPENVLDEIEIIVKKHKLDMFVVTDDTFTWHTKNVEEICRGMIKRGINVLWRCQTRVNAPRETLHWMKKAGCIAVAFGVESGSQKILDNIQKNIKIADIKTAFKNCHEVGILTHAYIMVGNIGEDKTTIQQTKDILAEIKPFNINVSITTPYPGTQLYDYAMKNNLLLSKDWEKYDHIIGDTSGIKLENMTPEEVRHAKNNIEKFFEENSKHYKRGQLLKSLDVNTILRLTKMAIKNHSVPFRLLRFQKKVTKEAGISVIRK